MATERFIHIEKPAIHVKVADAIGGILDQSAIVGFRVPQFFLRVVPLLAPAFFLHSQSDGQRQAVQAILIDTIERAFAHERVRHVFFQNAGGQDERNVLVRLLQEFERFHPRPTRHGVIAHNHIVGLRAQSFSELRRGLEPNPRKPQNPSV